MGDYINHSKETGQYLCNSFDDVVKIKRNNNSELAERQLIELR